MSLTELIRTIGNVNCVSIDRSLALQDWNRMCSAVARSHDQPDHMASYFWRDNHASLLRSKCLFGVMGHRSRRSRKWIMFTLTSRRIERGGAK